MKPPKLPEVEIPKEITEPSKELTEYSALIYGPSGIGKTTLASRADGVLFLATEPGLQGVRHRKIECPTWEHLIAAKDKIQANPGSCKLVVLDTVEGAYSLCERYVLREFGADHLNQGALGFGQGKQVVSNHFFTMIQDLCRLPQGFWAIAHATTREVPDPAGDFQRLEPNLKPELSALLLGYLSLILSCEYESAYGPDGQPAKDDDGNEKLLRIIRTGGDRKVLAKDRSGRLPVKLPLSYFALKKAWDEGLGPTGVKRSTTKKNSQKEVSNA